MIRLWLLWQLAKPWVSKSRIIKDSTTSHHMGWRSGHIFSHGNPLWSRADTFDLPAYSYISTASCPTASDICLCLFLYPLCISLDRKLPIPMGALNYNPPGRTQLHSNINSRVVNFDSYSCSANNFVYFTNTSRIL